MSTQYYNFSGTAEWAMVYRPDTKYQNFKINVYLDDTSWEKFKESGLSLAPKKGNGEIKGEFITFRRPERKLIKGDVVEFGPPDVFGPNGEQDYRELIGNGSKVSVNVSVYDTMKGKGHRLNSVHVLELVKYVPKAGDPNTQSETPAEKLPEDKTELNDEMPF